MGFLVTCKTEEDPLKTESARVVIKDLPLYKFMQIFYDAQWQLNQQSSKFYGCPCCLKE